MGLKGTWMILLRRLKVILNSTVHDANGHLKVLCHFSHLLNPPPVDACAAQLRDCVPWSIFLLLNYGSGLSPTFALRNKVMQWDPTPQSTIPTATSLNKKLEGKLFCKQYDCESKLNNALFFILVIYILFRNFPDLRESVNPGAETNSKLFISAVMQILSVFVDILY